ncbi:hypothetical protein GCM10028787_32780 [Brachybacterium horti]
MSGKKAKADRARLREELAAAAAGPAYWHGGPDGLTVGSTLLPLTELCQLPADSRLPITGTEELDFHHVSFTTDALLARDYAARWDLGLLMHLLMGLDPDGELPPRNPWQNTPRMRGGSLYRVHPLGAVTPDADYPEGTSFLARRARIIAVEEAAVPFATKPAREVLHYQTWRSGERLWDDDGYALPTQEMVSKGVTSAALRNLGYAPDPEVIQGEAEAIFEQRVRVRRP